MGDSIRYSVSVTPVEEIADESAGTHEVITGEVGKSIGGSGIAVVTDYSGTAAAQGYKDATVNYLEVIDSADTTDVSSELTASFVFIKNTGYTYSSATVLGDALAKSVKVMIFDGVATNIMISILDAGESIILKDDNAGIVCTGIHVRTVNTDGSANAAAGHLAAEILVVD